MSICKSCAGDTEDVKKLETQAEEIDRLKSKLRRIWIIAESLEMNSMVKNQKIIEISAEAGE